MKRILIVEDERLILWALGKTLDQDQNYQIMLAQGATEALDLMERYVMDLIITDIKLPGKSGWELIDKAKELSPKSKSIVILAYFDSEAEKQAESRGANFWFEKPVPLNELRDRVKSLF